MVLRRWGSETPKYGLSTESIYIINSVDKPNFRYFKLLFCSKLVEKIERLFNEFGASERFRVYLRYRTGSDAFAFYFKDDRLKRCLDCKEAFFADPEKGGCICKKRGHIEEVDGTVFIPEQRCNKTGSPSKWEFKYYLDHLLGNDFLEKLGNKYDPSGKLLLFELRQKIEKQKINPKFLTINDIRQLLRAIKRPDLYKYPTLLLRELSCRKLPSLTEYQPARVSYLYAAISDYLPKNISYAFICYKILDQILEGPQREILLFIKLQKPATHHKNERHWRSAFRAAGFDLLA